MSNVTKDMTSEEKAAADVKQAVEAAAEAIAGNAESAVAAGKAAEELAQAAQKAQPKGKKSGNRPTKDDGGASALQAVGKAACKRHGLPAVWVTADGQSFAQENDARSHGKSLGQSAEPLKVEA